LAISDGKGAQEEAENGEEFIHGFYFVGFVKGSGMGV